MNNPTADCRYVPNYAVKHERYTVTDTRYHPYIRNHTSHRIPHPVIIFLNPKMLSPGCVILCQLRYCIIGYGSLFSPKCATYLCHSTRLPNPEECVSKTVVAVIKGLNAVQLRGSHRAIPFMRKLATINTRDFSSISRIACKDEFRPAHRSHSSSVVFFSRGVNVMRFERCWVL